MLQVNFILIYVIHKILVLLKITRILKRFFKEYNRLLFIFFRKSNFFSQHLIMKSSRLEEDKNIEENIIKDVRNLIRLKKLKKKQMMMQIKIAKRK